jgi:hypothetical protein
MQVKTKTLIDAGINSRVTHLLLVTPVCVGLQSISTLNVQLDKLTLRHSTNQHRMVAAASITYRKLATQKLTKTHQNCTLRSQQHA